MSDSLQILILLILINVALCSYYYLLYQDSYMKKEEDALIARLDEKFTNYENENGIKLMEPEGTPSIIHGFHDKFSIDNEKNNKMLGWRYFYLKNQSKQEIEGDNNFDGVMTKNYLDNLQNVQNYIVPEKNRIR